MSVLPVSNNLRNPAMPVDNVYQTGTNLKVSNSRVLAHDCFEHDFETKQFGGSSITLTVPSNALFSDIMCYFKWEGIIAQGYYLPPLWGYKIIRDITYIWGGSEQLRLTGEANFLRMVCESDDGAKRYRILELGGDLTSQARDAGDSALTSADAAVHIYAPCSSVNSKRQIPYDADLLNGNITIRIALKSAAEVWSTIQSAGEASPGPLNASMLSLNTARWYLRQFTLVDTTASKKDEVGPNGQYMQPYFWYHSHTFSSGQGAIAVKADAIPEGVSQDVSVTLNGFTNGSLQSMILYVQRADDNYKIQGPRPAAPPGVVTQPAYMDCRQLRNIEILYNGRCVYKGEFHKIAQLLDLSLNTAASTYESIGVRRDGDNVKQNDVDNNNAAIYRIQVSQFSEVFRDYLQTGAELSANTMQLRFRIVDPDLTVAAAEERKYTCNVEYIYQASVTVQRGVGRFDFQNPLPAPVLSNLPAIAP
jgi:hypothetical protein